MNLGHDVKITRVSAAAAAGITAVNSAVVDTQDYDGVMFIALFGTITATGVQSLKAQMGALANGSDQADIAGSKATVLDTQSGFAAVVDIVRPTQRYVRGVVQRATANSVVDGIIAIQYRADKRPTVQDAASIAATVILQSPALGTP
jgi:hypothetical protein